MLPSSKNNCSKVLMAVQNLGDELDVRSSNLMQYGLFVTYCTLNPDTMDMVATCILYIIGPIIHIPWL